MQLRATPTTNPESTGCLLHPRSQGSHTFGPPIRSGEVRDSVLLLQLPGYERRITKRDPEDAFRLFDGPQPLPQLGKLADGLPLYLRQAVELRPQIAMRAGIRVSDISQDHNPLAAPRTPVLVITLVTAGAEHRAK